MLPDFKVGARSSLVKWSTTTVATDGWLRDGHLTQAKAMRLTYGNCTGILGKRIFLSVEIDSYKDEV